MCIKCTKREILPTNQGTRRHRQNPPSANTGIIKTPLIRKRLTLLQAVITNPIADKSASSSAHSRDESRRHEARRGSFDVAIVDRWKRR